MTKHESGKLENTESSGNVFADLELRHPESLMRKSSLLIEIELKIRRVGISRKVAAARMNLPEETLANMMRGQFNNIAGRRIKEFLKRLAQPAIGHQ
jgi:predicted XRE-type DNA-binding protein